MADEKRRRRRADPDEKSEGGTKVRRRKAQTDDAVDEPDGEERPKRQRARRGSAANEDRQESRQGSDDRSSDDSRPRRRAGGRGPTGAQLAQVARRQLAEITGLDAESVTSLGQADDGTWKVTVELLELSRIPESDDVLGSYEVQLDEEGELLAYERVERYARSQSGRQDRRGA